MSDAVNVDAMSARDMLNYYQEGLNEKAREYKKQGKPICWSSSVAPSEIFVTMDIPLCYPETHAAGIGAKKGALDMLEITENKGYNVDLCSYARINLAFMELLMEKARTGKIPEKLANCPGADIPLPDIVVTTNNICNTLLKWYENIAYELKIPCVIIDVPFNHHMPVEAHSKKYIAAQIEAAIPTLEKITGKKFDREKFKEVQAQTQRSVKWWLAIAEEASYKPSPLNGFDLMNFMALIVCARSLECSEKTFKKFVEELQANRKIGKFAFGDNEKMRVAWEGIAVWPHLSHTFKTLKNLGMLLTGSTYPSVWNLKYDVGDIEAMGEGYSKVYTNTCLENRAKILGDVGELAKCDGVLFHQNRSCKLMCILNQDVAKVVQKRLKTPYVMFDGDQTDPRSYAPAQYETRVQSLSEMVAQEK
jgi:benzoyl-CoA reductase/2-hydroxyglutaryl-CoA dehydratase subunit BcrC/BadD/HgdB